MKFTIQKIKFKITVQKIKFKEIIWILACLTHEYDELCLKNVSNEDINAWINEQKRIYKYSKIIPFYLKCLVYSERENVKTKGDL